MAAMRGWPASQVQVGRFYAQGRGVLKDDAEAVKWFRNAAERGDEGGQFCLGLYLAQGHAIAKNDTEAYKWWLLSSSKGIEDAKENLEILERRLTPVERSEGQRRAREFTEKSWAPIEPPEQKPANPNDAAVEAQQRAIAKHPSLGVADSPLNQEFVARVKWYRTAVPNFFNNPDWAIDLAEQCEKYLREKE